VRRFKVWVWRERQPPVARIWWKTLIAQQSFFIAAIALVPLVMGHWLFALLMLAFAASGAYSMWRRWG
jgi:hypothetical protein